MTLERVLVVRYSEIGLKGGNRREFEKALAASLKHALRGLDHGPVQRPRGRVVVRNPADPERCAAAAAEVFGVASVSPAVSCAPEDGAMEETARALMEGALAARPGGGAIPFRVETRRSDKSFHLTSMELSARLGAVLLECFPRLKVDLHEPRVTLGVEVRGDEALLFVRRLEGPGGIPVGTMGSAVALLSGGIDSPVASWLTMKRGTRVIFMTFHSYPFLSEASLAKVEDLARRLARFQHGAVLYVTPFADIQVAVKKACPEALRTVLYRRMMVRLASRLARREGALALVTGESVGQVASQTLENIRAIGAAAEFPVLRPLIGFDKTESIDLARRIGTYAISIQPFPDCCTVFQPRHPRIRSTLAEVEEAEEALDVGALCDEAFAGLDRRVFR